MSIRGRILRFLPPEGRFWLLAGLGLFVAGWIKGINLVILLAYFLLGIWLLNLAVAMMQVRQLCGRRRALGPIFAGAQGFWDVEVSNVRPRSAPGWRIADTGAGHRHEWFLGRLGGNQTVRLRARTDPMRRGRYSLAPLLAGCLHPFGLVQIWKELAPAEEWLILPALGHLNVPRFRQWLARMGRGEGRRQRIAKPSMLRQDDLHGLRPFRPGDSPRWIHWRTSARRNEKMVREFEDTSGQDLILTLDPWCPVGDAEPSAEFEAAVSLLATICWAWNAQRNDHVMLVLPGGEPAPISGLASQELAIRMLHALAVANSTCQDDLESVIAPPGRKLWPDAPVVLVSVRPESPWRERWAGALNRPVYVLTPKFASAFYDAPSCGGVHRQTHESRPVRV
jgi:uncharacterized protein (DUF58 family)